MAEPTVSQYPTAYDDDSTLLGALIDQRSFSLVSSVEATDTTLNLGASAMEGIDLPIYLTFNDATNMEDNEIVYCEDLDTGGNPIVSRGCLNSSAQAHDSGARLYIAYMGKHATLLLKAILAAEKYQGLVGSGDPQPTAITPEYGISYVDSTNERVWFADDAEWIEYGPSDHGRWDGSGADDHTQYHNDARKATWHKALEAPSDNHNHVQDGNSHDHSKGNGAGRIQSGPYTGLGSASYEREIYYDLDNDELYVANAALAWVKITGAPQDCIAFYRDLSAHGDACPAGWSRFTGLDERFPLACETGQLPSDYGTAQVEGQDTHAHDYTDVPTHYHSVSPFGATVYNTGGHSHSVKIYDVGSGDGMWTVSSRNTSTLGMSSVGDHTHTADMPSDSTGDTKRTSDDAAGVSTGTTEDGSSLPPYYTGVFCEKD